MLARWMDALFGPRYPRHYTGRHRPRRSEREPDSVGIEVAEIR